MAKETDIHPALLFAGASILSAAGWWMASFPLLGFIGMAPLFALTDRAQKTDGVWEKMEWVLLSLTVAFFAAHHFQTDALVLSMAEAILFTLPFVAHVWVRQTLGPRAGKITIVLFWLAVEYLLIKTFQGTPVYLSDIMALRPNWVNWNVHTGYLGATLWLLLTNLFVYEATLSRHPFRWSWVAVAVIGLLGPLLYSLYTGGSSITRTDMVNLYLGNPSGDSPAEYLARGEWVVRTAAWTSTLILLFTLVRNKINR